MTSTVQRGDSKAEASALAFERYQRIAPSIVDLEKPERRFLSGEIQALRQTEIGVYSWIENGKLRTSLDKS